MHKAVSKAVHKAWRASFDECKHCVAKKMNEKLPNGWVQPQSPNTADKAAIDKPQVRPVASPGPGTSVTDCPKEPTV